MFDIVKVSDVRPAGDYRLHLSFSDGSSGEHDFAELVQDGGPIVEPLRDLDMFARAFTELGVPTWPNGFAVDAIALHMTMAAAGELKRNAAE